MDHTLQELISGFEAGKDPELKTYLSNAPADTPRTEGVRVAGMRWPVETWP